MCRAVPTTTTWPKHRECCGRDALCQATSLQPSTRPCAYHVYLLLGRHHQRERGNGSHVFPRKTKQLRERGEAGQSEDAPLRRLRPSRGERGNETRSCEGMRPGAVGPEAGTCGAHPRGREAACMASNRERSWHVELNVTRARTSTRARAQARTRATVGTRPSRYSFGKHWVGRAIKGLPALPGRDSTPGPTGPGPRMRVRAAL